MLINLIKFIHVLLAIGLMGSTAYCLLAVGSKKFNPERTHKHILYFSLAALLTGIGLVHPKHFTLHTPWIEAAILLVFIFSLSIVFLTRLKNKISLKNRWFWRVIYLLLIVLLLLISHDAVTKTTFLPL